MKRSSWFGLWNNNDKKYMISQTIKINDIKKFVENDNFRIIVKKNKYYKKTVEDLIIASLLEIVMKVQMLKLHTKKCKTMILIKN